MLNLYRAIEPYLAALGLTALSAGVIFAALFGAMRWFGESWINSKFSERLAGRRPAVRSGTKIRLPSLRPQRRRCAPEFQLGRRDPTPSPLIVRMMPNPYGGAPARWRI